MSLADSPLPPPPLLPPRPLCPWTPSRLPGGRWGPDSASSTPLWWMAGLHFQNLKECPMCVHKDSETMFLKRCALKDSELKKHMCYQNGLHQADLYFFRGQNLACIFYTNTFNAPRHFVGYWFHPNNTCIKWKLRLNPSQKHIKNSFIFTDLFVEVHIYVMTYYGWISVN